jgi:hypothetical protein
MLGSCSLALSDGPAAVITQGRSRSWSMTAAEVRCAGMRRRVRTAAGRYRTWDPCFDLDRCASRGIEVDQSRLCCRGDKKLPRTPSLRRPPEVLYCGAQIERDPHPRAGPLLRPVRQLPLGNDRRRSLTFADACSAAGEAQESEHGGHC